MDGGSPLVDGSSWKAGGTVELAGRRYEVRANLWGSKYGMVDEDGTRIASADRVGGKTGRSRRTAEPTSSAARHGGAKRRTCAPRGDAWGSVKRDSIWRGDAVADLPGLPLSVEVFVLAVVLTKWDSDAATAATAG
jgi:hypothetical protein